MPWSWERARCPHPPPSPSSGGQGFQPGVRALQGHVPPLTHTLSPPPAPVQFHTRRDREGHEESLLLREGVWDSHSLRLRGPERP